MPSFRAASVATAVFAIVVAVLSLATPASADHVPYSEGDLFVAVGSGIVRRFDAQGEPIEDLDTETGSAETGDMCFADGRMYTMNFNDQSISLFDGSGGLIESRWADIGSGLAGDLESCVLDDSGNLYVGYQAGTPGTLQKLNAAGDVVETYETEALRTDQIDLAADQCTMLYTTETGDIGRFDVCEGEDKSPFATGIGSTCNNLRIRPNGEVLVACDLSVYRLDPGGEVIQTYEPADENGAANAGLFALNLENDGQHFYTATYLEGLVWRIDIDSGEGADTPYIQTVIEGDSIGGLAIFGEITVAAGGFVQTEQADIVRAVPDPTDISTEPGVVGTNVAFAAVIAIAILLSSQIFNETIEENNQQVESFFKRYIRPAGAPLRALRDAWRNSVPGDARFARFAGVGIVLVATALVYGFLEPGFSFNSDGVMLVVSVVLALAAVTYVYSGVEARITERDYKIPSAVRVYPVAFGIAVASVVVSRLLSFEPGIVYGFVASNVVLGAGEPDPRQKGRAVTISVLALTAAFAVAWVAMIPLREFAQDNDNFVSVILEASATLIVVGALETLVFSMVPIEFTDGIKVWRYNKIIWFVLAVLLIFLFWHVLLVQDKAGFDAFGSQGMTAAIIAVALCVGITGAVWGYFYWQKQQAAKTGAGVTPVVAGDDGMTPLPVPFEEPGTEGPEPPDAAA